MTRPRRAFTAALVSGLALLSLATTACAASTRNTRTAIDILNDAVATTAGQPFTYTLTYGAAFAGNGAQDVGARKGLLTMTMSDAAIGAKVKISSVLVGSDVYLKFDLGALNAVIPGLAGVGDKWMHVDAAKAPILADLGVKPGQDMAGPDNYIKGVVSAKKASDTRVTGKLDLSRASVPAASHDEIAQLGADECVVPFTVTLDGSGRITTIVVNMPKTGDFPASDLTTGYSNYGTAVSADKPAAAEVIEAPDLVYTFLQ